MITKNKKYFIYAWLMCILGAIFYAYEYFLRIMPSVMEIPLRAHFSLTASGFGLLAVFYYYAYVPMQLPVGVLMDRFGPRRLLTLACLICVGGSLLFANTKLFHFAAFGRFLVGLGSAFGYVGVLKLATIWLPEDRIGFVAGSASALGTITAMVGDNLLGDMVYHIGWERTIETSAYVGIILAIILWLFIRDKASIRSQQQVGTGTIDNFRKSMIDVYLILKNPQIWVNGLYGCLVYLPTTVFAELWGIPYLIHAQGLSHSGAEFCNSMLFLGFTVGAPLNGFISDKIKRRKSPMVFGSLGGLLVVSIIIYVPNLGQHNISILMFLLGLFYSAQALVFAVGRELSPVEAAGTAIAATNMLVMIGAIALQPLVGKLLDLSHFYHLTEGARSFFNPATEISLREVVHSAADYRMALSIIPFGMALAAFLTIFLKETHAAINEKQ